MFKLQFVLYSADEAREALTGLDRALEPAEMSPLTKLLLRDQIDMTLRQIANQMSMTNLQAFRVYRTFEGNGYKVSIKAVSPPKGTIAQLKRFLGRL